ncbi:MAG: hypothetical protein IJ157_06530, partial [Clostridia bacterium]|nr:hypothetical protein [Clostridia bacterium]
NAQTELARVWVIFVDRVFSVCSLRQLVFNQLQEIVCSSRQAISAAAGSREGLPSLAGFLRGSAP